jgi:hypothetical protein
MARDAMIMIMMRKNPFRGPLKEVGPENRVFGLKMTTSKAVDFVGVTSSESVPFPDNIRTVLSTYPKQVK